MRVQVAGRAELQLGDTRLLVLVDCDLSGTRQELLLLTHHLNELFQIFNFLRLQATKQNFQLTKLRPSSRRAKHLTRSMTYHFAFLVPLINII